MQALGELERLKEGNRRFVEGAASESEITSAERREALAKGQSPSAVILGCADSRVPPELVFDRGLGELFVVRVAGNVAGNSQIGSVEFAVNHLGPRLVVVLGHSDCGAVKATLGAMEAKAGRLSRGLSAVVDRVRPSLESWVTPESREDESALMARAVRENVLHAVRRLERSLSDTGASDEVKIVGAQYDLASGVVEFFER